MAQQSELNADRLAARTRLRADRALGGTDVGELFARYRAVIGPPADQLSELARSALEDLQNGITPGPEALQALELAIRLMRPAPRIRHGVMEPLEPEGEAVFPEWRQFQEAVAPYLSAVARIDRRARPGSPMKWESIGTGFLVGPTSLATNRHVVDQLTFGTWQVAPGQCVAHFGQESQVTPDPPGVAVEAVAAIHPDLDLAVLRIEFPSSENFPTPATPIPLELERVNEGTQVGAVGYPAEDPRNPAFTRLIFAPHWGVKRVAVGEVLGTGRNVFFHDCTTLGGNSGSPVFTLNGAKLAGVHFTGFYLARNEALSSDSLVAFLEPFVTAG